MRTLRDTSTTGDIGHYIRRAREERELAVKADTLAAANAHRQLAGRYDALLAWSDSIRDGTRSQQSEYDVSIDAFRSGSETSYSSGHIIGFRPSRAPQWRH